MSLTTPLTAMQAANAADVAAARIQTWIRKLLRRRRAARTIQRWYRRCRHPVKLLAIQQQIDVARIIWYAWQQRKSGIAALSPCTASLENDISNITPDNAIVAITDCWNGNIQLPVDEKLKTRARVRDNGKPSRYDDLLIAVRAQEAIRNARQNNGYKAVVVQRVRVILPDKERPTSSPPPCITPIEQLTEDNDSTNNSDTGTLQSDLSDCDSANIDWTEREPAARRLRFGVRRTRLFTKEHSVTSPNIEHVQVVKQECILPRRGILQQGQTRKESIAEVSPQSQLQLLPVVRVEVPQYKNDLYDSKRYRGINEIILRHDNAPDTPTTLASIKVQSVRARIVKPIVCVDTSPTVEESAPSKRPARRKPQPKPSIPSIVVETKSDRKRKVVEVIVVNNSTARPKKQTKR